MDTEEIIDFECDDPAQYSIMAGDLAYLMNAPQLILDQQYNEADMAAIELDSAESSSSDSDDDVKITKVQTKSVQSITIDDSSSDEDDSSSDSDEDNKNKKKEGINYSESEIRNGNSKDGTLGVTSERNCSLIGDEDVISNLLTSVVEQVDKQSKDVESNTMISDKDIISDVLSKLINQVDIKSNSIDHDSDESEPENDEISRQMILNVEESVPTVKPKVKNEVLIEELPEEEIVEKIELTNKEHLNRIGVVISVVQKMIVIKADLDAPPVDVDSVFFLQDRSFIGKVFDTFGQVKCPFYSIRVHSEINEHVKANDVVYFVPYHKEYTQYIFVEELKKLKGSDASWKNDCEPPTQFLDYSDDEAEQEMRRQAKIVKRMNKNDDDIMEITPQKSNQLKRHRDNKSFQSSHDGQQRFNGKNSRGKFQNNMRQSQSRGRGRFDQNRTGGNSNAAVADGREDTSYHHYNHPRPPFNQMNNVQRSQSVNSSYYNARFPPDRGPAFPQNRPSFLESNQRPPFIPNQPSNFKPDYRPPLHVDQYSMQNHQRNFPENRPPLPPTATSPLRSNHPSFLPNQPPRFRPDLPNNAPELLPHPTQLPPDNYSAHKQSSPGLSPPFQPNHGRQFSLQEPRHRFNAQNAPSSHDNQHSARFNEASPSADQNRPQFNQSIPHFHQNREHFNQNDPYFTQNNSGPIQPQFNQNNPQQNQNSSQFTTNNTQPNENIQHFNISGKQFRPHEDQTYERFHQNQPGFNNQGMSNNNQPHDPRQPNNWNVNPTNNRVGNPPQQYPNAQPSFGPSFNEIRPLKTGLSSKMNDILMNALQISPEVNDNTNQQFPNNGPTPNNQNYHGNNSYNDNQFPDRSNYQGRSMLHSDTPSVERYGNY